jgi:hypothetical protein
MTSCTPFLISLSTTLPLHTPKSQLRPRTKEISIPKTDGIRNTLWFKTMALWISKPDLKATYQQATLSAKTPFSVTWLRSVISTPFPPVLDPAPPRCEVAEFDHDKLPATLQP